MLSLFRGSVWKSSVGLAGGFLGAFLGILISRVFLSNNVDSVSLGYIFGINGLTALAVVLAVEGFTSAVPLTFKNPEKHVKGLLVVSTVLTVVVSLFVFVLAGVIFSDYGFLFEYWWLILLGIIFSIFVSAGQAVEAVSSVVGRNWVAVWRRTSVQFIGLGLFILSTLSYSFMNESVVTVSVWFICTMLGSIVAFMVGLWLLLKGDSVTQLSVSETWSELKANYIFHHFSKLGIVLPRFIIPVLILGLFGFEINAEFVVLWTVLGLFTVLVSAVTRAYMSHYEDSHAWSNSWKVWGVIVLLPLMVTAVFSGWVVGLFGESFAGLDGLLLVGLLALLPYSVVDFMLARLRVLGNVKFSSGLSVAAGVVLVASVILGGFMGGMSGIMWSQMLVYLLFAVILTLTVLLLGKKL